MTWWCVTGIGLATAGLLWIYDRFVRQEKGAAPIQSGA